MDASAECAAATPFSWGDLPYALHLEILTLAVHDSCALRLRSISRICGVCSSWRQLGLQLFSQLAALNIGDSGEALWRARPDCAAARAALPHMLRRCGGLVSLQAHGATDPLPGDVLAALHSCRRLEALDLKFASLQGPQQMELFVRQSAGLALKRLMLTGCGSLVHSGAWVVHLPFLEELDVGFCRDFNPPAGWLLGCTDDAQPGLPRRVSVIKSLDVRGAEALRLQEFVEGAAACALEVLNLAFTAADDDLLMELAKMPRLRTLKLAAQLDNLWMSGAWTEAGLLELRRRRPDIEVQLRHS